MKSPTEKDLQRELRRGTLELVLLRLLADEPTHGYELLRRLRRRGGGALRLKEGTVYPVLYRLESASLIEADWRPPAPGTRGVPRKVYRVTEAGAERLAELTEAWRSFTASVDALLAPADDPHPPTEEDR